MARRKEPTTLKLLRGNPGKKKLGPPEPAPDIGIPKIPRHLTRTARKEWRRIVPLLFENGLVTLIDMAALAGYCQSFARMEELETLATDTNDPTMKLAILRAARQQAVLYKTFAVEFGMTPGSRT
jgi:P27 family predicted phage terminase small subunit